MTNRSQLLELVAVMDRLRSPGGCPWDAEQTHESLLEYLVEETYETVESIEMQDRPGLRQELGDLLLELTALARLRGWDGESALRGAVRRRVAEVRTLEGLAT